MTVIRVPGQSDSAGWMDWGERTVPEMIGQYRSYADHWRAVVAAIDATPDEGFHVEIVRGRLVRHPVKTLQPAA